MILAAILFAAAAETTSPVPVARVAEDARVIDRVAQMSKRDLPTDLLRRLVDEDIEMLRGRRADGTYAYATYERLESGRRSESYSVDTKDPEKQARMEIKGSWVYRLVISVPTRRMLVVHNHKIFIDHIEIEQMPAGATATKIQNVKVGAWIDPGVTRTIDLDDVARQATVRAYGYVSDEGYSDVDLSLLEAKIVDNGDSPYADAVAAEKAILRGLDHNDIPSIRSMAVRVGTDLQPTTAASAPAPAASTVEVNATRTDADVYGELLAIEDLLTGSETERRQGVDRLHQLIRRLRQSR